ncbi:MAG: KEOPS complex kinase/ATPase Bud32 [Candidatus Nitrosocosmicus sp.]
MIKNKKLLRKGAESELYLIDWYGQQAVSKTRITKKYRHHSIDVTLRKQRTLHEATIMSSVKFFGVQTPFIYFLNSNNFEIIMEYVIGSTIKNNFSSDYCVKVGEIIANLHINNIIHGDITTSNFIITPQNRLTIIDFGLSFFSERLEDKAADIRLFKEILNSVHVDFYKKSFENFTLGYSKIYGKKHLKIFNIVDEIEQRGRYSRQT